MFNALTIDVEDYFHVTAFEGVLERRQWDGMEARIERNCEKILQILDEYKVKATFFVLGWVAERYPVLIRTIFNEGHEIACHGFSHEMITRQSKDSFRQDIAAAKGVLEDITGSKVNGYRAPTFSINTSSLWALNVLCEQGFSFDSSIFPIRHDRYGIPDANRFPHIIELNGSGSIREFPLSTIQFLKWNIPIAGGAYLRFLPVQLIAWGINRINKAEHQPAVIYLHPWELDPEQPRIAVHGLSSVRHYFNLSSTENKLRYLIKRCNFTTVNKIALQLFRNN